MLVRAPRLRVLLLEPYADYEDLINNQLPPVRENLERLDLFVSVGRQGTGRWSRAAEAADYTNLSTIPIAVSPHEWLAEEVAQFDLPVTT